MFIGIALAERNLLGEKLTWRRVSLFARRTNRYHFASDKYIVDMLTGPSISEQEARKLLDALCVHHGYCLNPLWTARLLRNPPSSPEKFIDTLVRAEGLDPVALPKAAYRAMLEKAREAFSRSAERIDDL